MKQTLIIILFGFICVSFSMDTPVKDCKCKGIPLKGKVKIVDHFADFDVQVVDHFPDLKVKKVDHFPDECGEWQYVDHFPDFTIRYVDHFPDFKIKFVEHFPGTP